MTIPKPELLFNSNFTETEETILAIILFTTICLSLYGNVCMLIVLYKNDKMWNSTNMLIGNLAFCGVLVTLLCMPFNLTSVLLSRWPFKEGIVCKLNAFATSALLLATILTHTMISVDKYFAVVKPFSRAMTVSRTWKIIFLIWFIAIIMSICPLAHIGQYEYNHTTLVCGVGFPKGQKDSLYLFLLATIGFAIPNLVIGHVYIKVFLAVRKHKKRLRKTSIAACQVVKLQKRLILTSFFSVLCFLACWTPFCILVLMATIVDTPDDLPRGLGMSAYWCGYLYNAINPLIICSMSSRFGEGLLQLTMPLARLPTKCVSCFRMICFRSSRNLRYSKGYDEHQSIHTPTITFTHSNIQNKNFKRADLTGTFFPDSPTISYNDLRIDNKNIRNGFIYVNTSF